MLIVQVKQVVWQCVIIDDLVFNEIYCQLVMQFIQFDQIEVFFLYVDLYFELCKVIDFYEGQWVKVGYVQVQNVLMWLFLSIEVIDVVWFNKLEGWVFDNDFGSMVCCVFVECVDNVCCILCCQEVSCG